MKLYSYDTNYVDEIISEFNIMSEELLTSIRNMLATIDGEAFAAEESEIDASDIAGNVN
jgi:methyl-accepting chemotaxis protein